MNMYRFLLAAGAAGYAALLGGFMAAIFAASTPDFLPAWMPAWPAPILWAVVAAAAATTALTLWGWAAHRGGGLAEPPAEKREANAPRFGWGRRQDGGARLHLMAGLAVAALLVTAGVLLAPAVARYLPPLWQGVVLGVVIILAISLIGLMAADEGIDPPWLWAPGRRHPFDSPPPAPRPPEIRRGTTNDAEGPCMDAGAFGHFRG